MEKQALLLASLLLTAGSAALVYSQLRKPQPVAEASFTFRGGKADVKRIIEETFVRLGFHPKVAMAAVVNAQAESSLNPAATAVEADGAVSTGLFQINNLRGARDFTGYNLKDPVDSIRWLVLNEKGALGKVQRLAEAGARVPELTAAFCKLVERPANADKKAEDRAAMARQMYPGQ